MNGVLALLGLGTLGLVAVAASSSAPKSNDPLVIDAEAMVRIFELYSRKRTELNSTELLELARFNLESKGLRYPASSADFPDEYSFFRAMWLPPSANSQVGPDAFSVWGDYNSIYCNQYMAGGFSGTGNAGPPSCMAGYVIDFFGRRIGNYSAPNVVMGDSDLRVIVEGYYGDLADAWEAAGPDAVKAIASAASNYPGIGTAIASAVTFLQAIGEGASLKDATLEAGRAAVPSALRAAYDVGIGLAVDGKLDYKSALKVAMALAISQGVITGDVLDRYNTIKAAYEDAQSVGAGLEGLGTAVDVAV